MIISHKYRFIFFAIPKTGTHSVRFALRPYLGANDEEQVNLFKPSKLSSVNFQQRKDGHMTAMEIKPVLSAEIWHSYFKFCFVRNPWDRFISTVFYRNKDLAQSNGPLIPRFHEVIDKQSQNPNLFYKTQASFVVDDNNKIMMDFIGKTETMQEDFNEICKRLQIPNQQLERRNSSPHDLYLQYYNAILLDRVTKIYAQDIALFNYHFDSSLINHI